MRTVEYRVRPVTRYVVTRWESDGDNYASCEPRGEFDNEILACNAVSAFGDSETLYAKPPGKLVTFRPMHGGESRREWSPQTGWDDNPAVEPNPGDKQVIL